MSSKVSISAVVPVYNVQDYLRECLNSICNQTEKFTEVILVNDGSEDDSKKICEEYNEKYEYITLINQENKGLSEARNVGIRAAKSEYIFFIDSDDYIEGDTVERLKEEIGKAAYDVVFFSASVKDEGVVKESAAYYIRDVKLCGKDMSGKEFFKNCFPANYIVSVCLAIYKRDFLKKHKLFFEKGIFFEDNDFSFRVCMLAQKIRCINKSFYIRRYRVNSIMSGNTSYKKCRDLIKINELLWTALEKAELEIKYKISFISYYLIHTWDVISESEYLKKVQKRWNNLAEIFGVKWLGAYLENEIEFNDELALYLVLKNKENGAEQFRNDLRKKIDVELIQRLEQIPIKVSNKIIGIYGIGKHTEKLLELYRTYLGEMSSNIIFIVTQKDQVIKSYWGCPLITSAEISGDIDYILVSSLKYQKDMIRILKENNVADSKIVKLYEKDEYCDFASVMRILKQ